MAEKIFCLDTNVLVHDPQAMFSFEEAHVAIPAMVLEELDKFKREGTDRGRSARMVIKYLDELRERGQLGKGVPLDNGGTLRVVFFSETKKIIMPFHIRVEDNIILLTALSLQTEGFDVYFISKDINARVKADALGLKTQDYKREHITQDEFYRGWRRIKVPAVQLKKEMPEELKELIEGDALTPNEFVLAESQHNPHQYRVFRYLGGKKAKTVSAPKLQWPLGPRNPQQLMALELLLDKDVHFVSLFGPAGTGKTFLALLAGLHEVLVADNFQKILVARPVVPLGRDIGYLPGSLQEKLYTWMYPIYDNMEFILHASRIGRHLKQIDAEQGAGYRGKRDKHGKHEAKQDSRYELRALDDLVRQGKISLEAITYMRGRSIPYQYILIDEAQNLTPHEVKTLVSRVGEGSKIILAGDPYQIDSPYLDFGSNGLVVSGERFKGQQLFGSVYLEASERSELSQLASDLL